MAQQRVAWRGRAAAYAPAWMRRVPLHVWALAGVCVVALLLRLWAVGGGSSDYDEGVYWQSLRAMADGHALFSSVFSSQPPFFLFGLYPFYLLFGQTLTAARLGVVVFSLVGILALYAIGRMLAGKWVGVLAAVLLAFDPISMVESRTLQAEVPSLAWQIVCVALAVAAARRTGRARRMLAAASGVALGLGIMTKLWDVVAVLPAVLYLSGVFEDGAEVMPLSARLRAALPALGLFAAGCVVAICVVLLPFAGELGLVYDQVVRFHTTAAAAAVRGLIGTIPAGNGLGYNVRTLAHAGELYPLGILGVIIVALAVRRRRRMVVPPTVWALASLALLLKQQPLFDHHRALLSPPLALLGALGLAVTSARAGVVEKRLSAKASVVAPRRVAALAALAALVVCAGLSVRAEAVGASEPASLQVQEASALARFTLPQDVVAADDQYVAGLADRSVPPELVDTSQVRIQSGYLTTQEVESILMRSDVRAVLFGSGRFDMLPGFRAWVEAHYTKIADFPNGGALYLKMPQGPQIT